ncbi:MAG TPA: RNA-splicing ligase RtcB [Clostridiales bacterium UBA8153]|nr:RNA-splicing ligase RtcB [Clostridiales bacterium UBA8153]
MTSSWNGPLEPAGECRWKIPVSYKAGMKVPGLIYASPAMLEDIRADQAAEQVANVAHLPGLVRASLAMPDIHWGYGFPIGGVAATGVEDGVIAPGGIGYDINCGVRLLRTNLAAKKIRDKMETLVSDVFHAIPAGVGSQGPLKLDRGQLEQVLTQGAAWAVEQGYGWAGDLEHCEAGGRLAGADAAAVSGRAQKRGSPQLGTLGSGNHFIEISVVDEVFDQATADVYGLEAGQAVVWIHSGSRGLGHQVCTDYLEVMGRAVTKYGIKLPDRQLACAPVKSEEGQNYFAGMAAAANYAWANRQVMTHWVRQTLAKSLGTTPEDLGLQLVYDVAHNIAKFEEHAVDGKMRKLCVHRKGATRAFGPGHPELPARYREVGQPVLVPGDMGRASYILKGTAVAMQETFGSACHGAGRVMSRTEAKKGVRGSELRRRLALEGVIVRAGSDASLAEEAPEAYKDVTQVVDATQRAGLAGLVVRVRPLGVIKG